MGSMVRVCRGGGGGMFVCVCVCVCVCVRVCVYSYVSACVHVRVRGVYACVACMPTLVGQYFMPATVRYNCLL